MKKNENCFELKFNTLDEVAQHMVNEFGFMFDTLNEAKCTVYYMDKKIIFDRFTFNIYEHQLSNEEKNKLIKKVKQIYIPKKEIEKERLERVILNKYLMINNYEYALIKKCVNPDFIVEMNNRKIGIEITSFKAEDIAIQDKIINKASGKALTTNELINIAKDVSITKYKQFDYSTYNGHAIISANLFDVNLHKEEFVKTIEKKIKKYDEVSLLFDEFIILVIAPDFEVTDEYDINDILSRISLKPKNKIKLCIIYFPDNIQKLYEVYL